MDEPLTPHDVLTIYVATHFDTNDAPALARDVESMLAYAGFEIVPKPKEKK